MARRVPLLILLSFVLACGDDGGTMDAGSSPNDSGVNDGGAESDGGQSDGGGGEADGGTRTDAGPPQDAGVLPEMPEGIEIVEEFVFQPNARFPEDDPNLVSVETSADTVTLTYSDVPTIPLEAGHVIAGRRAFGYLRSITSVSETSDNVFELGTEDAELTDVILRGHARGVVSPDAGDWIYTVDGVIQAPLVGDSVLNLISGLRVGAITCEGAADLGMVSIEPDVDLDPDLEIDIQIEEGELLYALFALGVELEISTEMQGSMNAGFSCNANEVPLGKLEFAFPVGPIPFVHEFVPSLNVQLAFQGRIDGVNATARTTLGARAGVEFDGTEWDSIWEPVRTGEITFDAEDIGRGQIDLSFSAGFKYGAKAWGALGVSAQYQRQKQAQISLEDCEWTASLTDNTNVVVGASIGLDLKWVDITLAEFRRTFMLDTEVLAMDSGELDVPACKTFDVFSCGAPTSVCGMEVCGPLYFTVEQGEAPGLIGERSDLGIEACTDWIDCVRSSGFTNACGRSDCSSRHISNNGVPLTGMETIPHLVHLECSSVAPGDFADSYSWWPGGSGPIMTGGTELLWSAMPTVVRTGECPGTTPCVDRDTGECEECS